MDGVYNIVDAQYPDEGGTYTGMVDIHPYGDVYRVTWRIGHDTYVGVGLLKGDMFMVGYGSSGGVVYYEQKGDGLVGRWGVSDNENAGVETLIRVHGPH